MKKISLFSALIMLGCSLACHSQFTEFWNYKYHHTLSNSFSNESREVVVDTISGRIFTLADVTSDKDPSGQVTGLTYNYTVINKFDSLGTLVDSEVINVFSHAVSGFDYKSGFGLELDASGNVYVAYTNYNATTDFDLNIAKYNSNLVLQWNYKYNPLTIELGIDFKVTPGGQAFALVKCTAPPSAVRYRVVKATGNGTSSTAFYDFNAYPDVLNSLAIDNNNNLYITGYRLLFNNKSIMTASLTNTGVLRWSRLDNGGTFTGDDIGRHITVGADGSIFVTGSSLGTVQHGNDVVTMKLNPINGKKAWHHIINFTLNDGGIFVSSSDRNFVYVAWVGNNLVYVDQIYSATGLSGRRATYAPIPISPYNSLVSASVSDMKASVHNNLYVTGNITAVSGGQQFSACYLIKVNFTGRGGNPVQMAKPVTGNYATTHKSASLALYDSKNKVLMLEDNYQDNGNHLQESVSLTSYHAFGNFRFGEENQMLPSAFQNTFMPNPATSLTTLASSEPVESVEIMDMTGKKVLDFINTNSAALQFSMDLSTLTNGIYVARIQSISGSIQISKLIKK